MSRRLIIVGAGGFGRECHAWASHIPPEDRDWEIAGFIDNDPEALRGYDTEIPLLGSIDEYQPRPGEILMMGIGTPKSKLRVAETLLSRGAQFLTFIHPTAVIGLRVRIGMGCIICPHVTLTSDIELGDFVMCNAHSTVGHDAVIGTGSTLSSHADVTGFARLGRGVFLGTHAAVLPNAKVGDFATVGAGSVVFKNVAEGTTVLGIPARPI
jgi:sugar O-acyltransferase (sialic acid O-acetyltransferase NeuD family)